MARIFEGNQTVLLQPVGAAEENAAPQAPRIPAPVPELVPAPLPKSAFVFAALASAFWVGTWGAYLWGYFGPGGLLGLDLQQVALFGAAALLPPILFLAAAMLFARSAQMGRAALALEAAAQHLFTADDSAALSAARLGRVVRRELDALNTGLEGAFGRLRTLENSLENQIAALDEAGARAAVRSEAIAARLTQDSQRLESLGDHLSEAAAKASETLAGRTAQLKAGIETAEGALKMAAQSLDVQAAGFRSAAQMAADAPREAAVELDNQAKKIEQVSDAALARAEFVLARQEKHRTQMNELLSRLKEDSAVFEAALSGQRAGMESAIGMLGGEAKRFEMVTGDAERHLELIMANAATRAGQLTTLFAREAERLTQTSEAANGVLTALIGTMRDAGTGAQTLIGESAAQAKHDAHALVGEAMAECERLLRAGGELAAQAQQIRAALAKTIEDVESHLTRLPTLAQGEAQRVRQMVQNEAEQILDLSARTLSTLHARGAQGRVPQAPISAQSGGEGEGLKGLARKLTQRPKRDLREGDDERPPSNKDKSNKSWEMKTLLAAVETGGQALAPGSAAALGALEMALADMAVDLDALVAEGGPGDGEWKRYLAGDRAVFARRLASVIDDTAVDRITRLYREDKRFHEAANAYLSEFETLLVRARDGDGGGLLTSTLLSADTGKIYLAIAYALGRL